MPSEHLRDEGQESVKPPSPTDKAWGVYAKVPSDALSALNPDFAELLLEVTAIIKAIEEWLRSRDILSIQVGYLKLAQAGSNIKKLSYEQVYRPEIEAQRLQGMREYASSYEGLSEADIKKLQEGLGVIATILMTRSKGIQLSLDYNDPLVSSAVDSHRHHAQGEGYYESKLRDLGTTFSSVDEMLVSLTIELAKKLSNYVPHLTDANHRMLMGNPHESNEEVLSLIYGLAIRIRGSKGIPADSQTW